jgi:cytochrome c biogenesis protein CcmG/thiol:disulfide interchange protein DsbE
VKRNHIVLFAVLAALSLMFWAGFANFEHRKQEQERRRAMEARLVPDAATAALTGNPYISPLQGKPAPAFTLEDLSGKKVSLADYHGKAVMLNFWATWCGPCEDEIPWLVEFPQKYAGQGFEILGISSDDLDLDDKTKLAGEKQEIKQFVDKHNISYPILLNGESITRPYGGVDALPSSFFVDPSGVVVASTVGLVSKDELEANIQKAMKGNPQL